MKYFTLLMFMFVSLFSSDVIGVVTDKKGIVKIKHKNSIKKESVKIDTEIFTEDKLYTYKSVAVITLKDKSEIKVGPYSTLTFGKKKITQEGGNVYYSIKKRKNDTLQVATQFTTIGVKGTTFIVKDNETKSVALSEGLVSIASNDNKAYELHVTHESYDKYSHQINDEYNSFKEELQNGFVSYKSHFLLKQNKILIFEKNGVVKEFNFNSSIENEFKVYNSSLLEKKKEEQNEILELKENIKQSLKELDSSPKKENKEALFKELDE